MNGNASAETFHTADQIQHFARFGADNADLGVLLGQVGGIDLPVPPFGLQPFLHMRVDPVGAAGRGVAQEGVVIDPRHHAVIAERKPFSLHISPYRQRPGFRVDIMLVYIMSRNLPASGPLTSSLPSVDASSKPRFLDGCS